MNREDDRGENCPESRKVFHAEVSIRCLWADLSQEDVHLPRNGSLAGSKSPESFPSLNTFVTSPLLTKDEANQKEESKCLK